MDNLSYDSLNWGNEYEVRKWVDFYVVPSIYETLVDGYGFTSEDYDPNDAYDHVWEIIDGLAEVIYNYQARKVADAFGVSPFDTNDVTGERWSSYNEMAFEIIRRRFDEKYSEQLDYML